MCESCATIILDIETPCLNLLVVNCRLVFENTPGKDITLCAKHVFVNAGTIEIGDGPDSNDRFDPTSVATIDLRGEPEFRSRIPGALCAGNKILSTVGKITAYGAIRSEKSRLIVSAIAGTN